MIQLYYHKFSTPFSTKEWMFYFQQMPEDIRARIRRYRLDENKYQCLIGRLLLKKGMLNLGFKDFRLSDIYYNENDCPLWREDIQFNIAHSGKVVVCAFSTKYKIGIDVEKIRNINLKDFTYILNDLDLQNIKKAAEPYQAFFKIWTIKEAVTKALGKGLAIDVQQIYIFKKHVIFEQQKWYFYKLDFEAGYAAHLVTNVADFEEINLTEVVF